MKNWIIKFEIILIVGLLSVMGLHLCFQAFNGIPFFEDFLIENYIINWLLASLIFIGLILFKNTFKDLLGFIFLGGSFLKFLVFFVVYAFMFNRDGETTIYEGFSFLIPYFVSLMIEALFLIKILGVENEKK